jgi:hypothetical protein
VIRNDGQHACRLEQVPQGGQRTLQPRNLIVDGNADRLKDARELRRSCGRTEDGSNRPDEVVRRGKPLVPPAAHDFSRHAMRPRFVGMLPQQRRQLLLANLVEKLRGRTLGVAPHAHVERSAAPEGEPALLGVELMRGNAEIEEDSIEALARNFRDLAGDREIPLENPKRSAVEMGAQAITGTGQRSRVAINGRHADTAVEERGRVPASTESSIEDMPCVA